MVRRKSTILQTQAPIALRKSPRFLYQNSRVAVVGEDGDEEASDVDFSPTKNDEAWRRSRRNCAQKGSGKSNRSSSGSKECVNSSSVLRRSPRLLGSVHSSGSLRRSPRLLSRGNSDSSVKESTKSVLRGGSLRKCVSGKCENLGILCDVGKREASVASMMTRRRTVLAENGVNVAVDTEKLNDTQELKRGSRKKSISSVNEIKKNEMLSYIKRGELVANSSHGDFETTQKKTSTLVGTNGFRNQVTDPNGKKVELVVGLCAERISNCDRTARSSKSSHVAESEGREAKEKDFALDRERGHESSGVAREWTLDQESALQNAYFTVKPTPNFWKKVSKLVPGKSAQECFDKVHSYQITPAQPRPRQRARKPKLSPVHQFSLSASKLLKPAEQKIKKPGIHKPKRGLAHKTIRQILEKQCHADSSHEADLFSVLESCKVLPNSVLSTPKEKDANIGKSHERSSSSHKRPRSRLINSSTTNLMSPPVLKQVKNKALHEKYIDQLHCREAKRKAEIASVSGKENKKPLHDQNTDVVRAAKNALLFDMKDAFNKLQGLKTYSSSSSSDYDFDSDDLSDEGVVNL